MTTRDKLLEAAATALAEDGVAGVSARTVAARAEVNQALVFYHFGTVDDLLDAAVRRSVDLAVATYHDRFADVSSLGGLLTLGRDLHRTEQERGNVAQMAQVLAGARRSPALAAAGRGVMDRRGGRGGCHGQVERGGRVGRRPSAAGGAAGRARGRPRSRPSRRGGVHRARV